MSIFFAILSILIYIYSVFRSVNKITTTDLHNQSYYESKYPILISFSPLNHSFIHIILYVLFASLSVG